MLLNICFSVKILKHFYVFIVWDMYELVQKLPDQALETSNVA